MLKTGPYNDTVASHFVLVNPAKPDSADENDVTVLDPAQPVDSRRRPWRLSDSARQIKKDGTIRREWRRYRIADLQLAGVWVFARWRTGTDTLLGGPYLAALDELAAGSLNLTNGSSVDDVP